jgi:hypothetical protein
MCSINKNKSYALYPQAFLSNNMQLWFNVCHHRLSTSMTTGSVPIFMKAIVRKKIDIYVSFKPILFYSKYYI